VIVDEPTAGLDPEERVRFRNVLSDVSGRRLVILSTHIVSDVEMAATGIALLRGGRLLGHHPPEEWLRAVSGRVWRWVVPSAELTAIQERFRVSTAVRRADGVHLRLVARDRPAPEAEPAEPTMEDAYMDAIGEAA
jgi:ABC-2 type transport system ATP-binding protein